MKPAETRARLVSRAPFMPPFWTALAGCRPRRAKTGNHKVECWRRAAELALLQVVHSSLAERSSLGHKNINCSGRAPPARRSDAAQLQKQTPAPGTVTLDHVRAHRRNYRRRRRRAQLPRRPRDPVRAAQSGGAVRERPLQRPHCWVGAMRSVKTVITGRLWVGETRLFATNSPHFGKAVRCRSKTNIPQRPRESPAITMALRPTE